MSDHERCSELLSGYSDGTLEPEEGAWVAAHLESCAGCTAELEGLKALRAEGESLSELERTRLHREVLHHLGLMTGPARSQSGWGPRVARLHCFCELDVRCVVRLGAKRDRVLARFSEYVKLV